LRPSPHFARRMFSHDDCIVKIRQMAEMMTLCRASRPDDFKNLLR